MDLFYNNEQQLIDIKYQSLFKFKKHDPIFNIIGKICYIDLLIKPIYKIFIKSIIIYLNIPKDISFNYIS
ncbi:hypothetical protein AN1V17_36690 [Vallitalea sediminicola]